jgi:hypothetical protein
MNKLSASKAALARLTTTRRLGVAAAFVASGISLAAFAGPFIYVGNTGEDTVSKIDVATNQEVARYAAWFTSGSNSIPYRVYANTSAGPAPSRIATDAAGNAYVLDRFFDQPPPAGQTTPVSHLPVLLKIAATGGVSGSTTSAGPVLQMLDNNPTDNHISPGEATDVRILWAKEIGATGHWPAGDEGALGRALCMDTTGNLWVGMFNSSRYYQVSPATGTVIGGPINTPGHTPYGCQVDTNGILWSAGVSNSLAEIDTKNLSTPAKIHYHSGLNYAVAVSNDCSSTPPKVKVYLSDQTGKNYITYDPQALAFTYPPPGITPFNVASYAIAVDSQGNIISGAVNGRVMKISPTGSVIWDTGSGGQPVTNLHGLIVDGNDDIWAVNCANVGQAIKYTGASGAWTPGQTVKIGRLPYTYANAAPPTCVAKSTPTPTPTPTATPTPTPTPGCASITDKEMRCLPDGSYSYTFNVTNNSGAAMSQVLLTPVSEGAFTLTPQLSNLGSPLASGQSITITTNIGHVKPGEKVCFFLSLLSDNAPCCIVRVCPALPQCGEVPSPTFSPAPRSPSPPPPNKRP